MILKYRNLLIEIGGHLAAVLLPLYINPFSRQSHEAGKVHLFQGITLGMLLIALASLVMELQGENNWQSIRATAREKLNQLRSGNPLLIPSVVYGGVYLLATLVSIDPATSWLGVETRQGTATILCAILFFILLSSAIREKKQIERLVTSLILGSIPVAIYGWVQFLGFDPLDWTSGSISQVQSTLVYSLYLGSYLAILLPLSLGRLIAAWRGGPYSVWGYGFVVLLQSTCLLFTLARGAWLGFTIGSLVLVGALAYRWQVRKLAILSVVMILLGGLIFVVLNTGLALPASTSFAGLSPGQLSQSRQVSNYERWAVWRYTLPLVTARPWLGYGPETFSSAFWLKYSEQSIEDLIEYPPWDPHNWFLYHLTAVGLLGLIPLIWLLVQFFRKVIAALKSTKELEQQIIAAGILGGATAYLIQAQFNPNAITLLVLLWFLLALGATLGGDQFERWNATLD